MGEFKWSAAGGVFWGACMEDCLIFLSLCSHLDEFSEIYLFQPAACLRN